MYHQKIDGKIVAVKGRKPIHGFAFRKNPHPLYGVWRSMIRRCTDSKSNSFHNYGGRGITVCPAWRSLSTFVSDMFPSWKQGLFLDRKNNNRGYSKSNCRWATWREQCLNKRTNRRVKALGKRMTFSQWEKFLGMPKGKISRRLYDGWTVRQAINIEKRYV